MTDDKSTGNASVLRVHVTTQRGHHTVDHNCRMTPDKRFAFKVSPNLQSGPQWWREAARGAAITR
jgi:hypothetical protein